jgi:hypothetical protein
MGISYNNVIMYGKEFDSSEEAADELLRLGALTEEQHEEALDDWSVLEDIGFDWDQYDYYNGEEGVLGIKLNARTLYTEPKKVKTLSAKVDAILGEGCKIHEFVSVC